MLTGGTLNQECRAGGTGSGDDDARSEKSGRVSVVQELGFCYFFFFPVFVLLAAIYNATFIIRVNVRCQLVRRRTLSHLPLHSSVAASAGAAAVYRVMVGCSSSSRLGQRYT